MKKSLCNIGERIKAEALRIGFDACGFAKAAPVSTEAAHAYSQWLREGKNDCMQWAGNYPDLRFDPTKLVPGAQTVISLALNYLPPKLQPADAPQIARYAYGDDYHEVARDMARELAKFIMDNTGCECRICVDSAPVLERYWAKQAGIGFIGQNTLLIIPSKGSYFFLCELITTLLLEPDKPCTLSCAGCHTCEKACPGGALKDGVLDASKCLSCQTIENHDAKLTESVTKTIGNHLYGCDECQICCPHNSHAQPTTLSAFQGRESIINLTKDAVLNMNQEQFSATFRHSAIKRTKLAGLQRNARLLEETKKPRSQEAES